MEQDEELVCGYEEITSKAPPGSPSTQATLEALTVAAWCDSLNLDPMLRKANNCSHCVLEIGHKLLAVVPAPLLKFEET